jgi:NAD(P)-dependent dehydrogenase (short-subunit alcohol dehydrogenase family)
MAAAGKPSLETSDGHYIVVRGRLWRKTNPHLPEEERARLVSELMTARIAVKEAAGDEERLRVAQITQKHIDGILGPNVTSVIFTVQKALPLLPKGASVILTGSSASIEGAAAFSVYSASKAAVRNLARSWVLDLNDAGIRVNVVSPSGHDDIPALDNRILEARLCRGWSKIRDRVFRKRRCEQVAVAKIDPGGEAIEDFDDGETVGGALCERWCCGHEGSPCRAGGSPSASLPRHRRLGRR